MAEPLHKAWKKQSGHFAAPTVILALVVYTLYGFIIYQCHSGSWPLWAGLIINSFLTYVVFTPMHEASHGNIKGNHHRWAWLENTIGWLSGLMLLAPYPAFKVLHLRHHSKTNDPELDPDYWVASRKPLMVFFKCITIVLKYYGVFLFDKSKAARDVFWISIFADLCTVSAIIAWGMLAGWQYPLLLWVLPSVIAFTTLAFLFDWLPHHPHNSRERFLDTRILLFPGLKWPLLWQNYHLIHHLFPRVPFYKYAETFREMLPLLKEKGSPIQDLRRRKK